jgi:hypothetical protein
MANPIPCVRCLEVADAHFLLTNRTEIPWTFDQATVGICMMCLIQEAGAWAQAMTSLESLAEEPTEPGALELMEADDGKVPVASAAPKRSRRKKEAPAPEWEDTPDISETEAADDQG